MQMKIIKIKEIRNLIIKIFLEIITSSKAEK